MPDYEVELSDGRIVTLSGDHPPSPDEAMAAIGSMSAEQLKAASGPPAPKQYSLSDFMHRTVGKSANEFYGGVAHAVTHPFEAANTLSQVAEGGAAKLMNALSASQGGSGTAGTRALEYGYQNFVPGKGDPALPGRGDATLPERLAEATGELYANKARHPLDTAYEDPVGTLADLSVLLSGGGSLLGKVGEAGELSNVARAGQITSRAGHLVNPLTPVTAGAQEVLSTLGTGATMVGLRPPKNVVRGAVDLDAPGEKTSRWKFSKQINRENVSSAEDAAAKREASKAAADKITAAAARNLNPKAAPVPPVVPSPSFFPRRGGPPAPSTTPRLPGTPWPEDWQTVIPGVDPIAAYLGEQELAGGSLGTQRMAEQGPLQVMDITPDATGRAPFQPKIAPGQKRPPKLQFRERDLGELPDDQRPIFDPNYSDKPETITREPGTPDPNIQIPTPTLRRWFKPDPTVRKPPPVDYFADESIPPGEVSVPPPMAGAPMHTPRTAPATPPLTPVDLVPRKGIPVQALVDAANELRPGFEALRTAGKGTSALDTLDEYIARLRAENPSGEIDLVEARAAKRALDKTTNQLQRNIDMSKPYNPVEQEIDNAIRRALAKQGEQFAPGVRGQDARTAFFEKARQAYEDAGLRSSGLTDAAAGAMIGTGQAGPAIAMKALTNPWVGTKLGRALEFTGQGVNQPLINRLLALPPNYRQAILDQLTQQAGQ